MRACFCPRNTSERNEILLFYEYFCSSERNSELFFSSTEWFGTEFQVFASIFVPWNGIPPVVFTSVEWFRMEFPEFAFIFVPRYRIPSISLLCRKVWNRSPRVFCSAEQPEFRRNKSIPSSAEFFLSEIANPSAGPHGLSPLFREGTLHRKKRFASFPSPAGISLPNSPWAGIMTS